MHILQRLGLLAAVLIASLTAGSAPASARSNQISGTAVYDFSGTTCTGPPTDTRIS